jgi:hypothetical protein
MRRNPFSTRKTAEALENGAQLPVHWQLRAMDGCRTEHAFPQRREQA